MRYFKTRMVFESETFSEEQKQNAVFIQRYGRMIDLFKKSVPSDEPLLIQMEDLYNDHMTGSKIGSNNFNLVLAKKRFPIGQIRPLEIQIYRKYEDSIDKVEFENIFHEINLDNVDVTKTAPQQQTVYDNTINISDITPEYLINRIPFLKHLNPQTFENGILYQAEFYNTDLNFVRLDTSGNMFDAKYKHFNLFPIFLVDKRHDGKDVMIFTFHIDNHIEIDFFQTEENPIVRQLGNSTGNIGLKLMLNDMKLEYHIDYSDSTGDIPVEHLDKIINDMNRKFFELEEFADKFEVKLF